MVLSVSYWAKYGENKFDLVQRNESAMKMEYKSSLFLYFD